MTKPTVLIIISNYLPGEKVGGPVRTISNMVEWLGDDFNFLILTSDRDVGDENPYPNIEDGVWYPVGKAQVRYLSSKEQSLLAFRRVLVSFSADLLYIDGVFAPFTVKTLILRRLNLIPSSPAIMVPRGQWRPEALNIKSHKKRVFMGLSRLFKLYHGLFWHTSSSSESEDVQLNTVAQADEIRAIPDLPSPLGIGSDRVKKLKRYKKLNVVFLSRIVRNKGLHFALEQLKTASGIIQLDIYGAIEDEAYWRECEAIISDLPDNIIAEYKGVVRFDAVVDTLSNYHLFVLPTLSENFGHVILEALLAGCPVLISDRTPWQDLEGAGWILDLDDPSAWRNAMQEMIDMRQEQFKQMSQNARNYGQRYQDDQRLADDLRAFLAGASKLS